MKSILSILFMLFAASCFAQKDTLVVDQSKYNFIKVGEKVYRIKTTTSLEEVSQIELILGGALTTPKNWYYNGTTPEIITDTAFWLPRKEVTKPKHKK